MNEIKKIVNNIMFTTGASLVISAVFLLLFKKEVYYAPVVLQIFAANIIINTGLFMIWKFEIRFMVIEYLVDVVYIIIVLVVFGVLFNWYSKVPVWFLVIMAVIIYTLAVIITVNRSKKDTDEINELLQKRREKV